MKILLVDDEKELVATLAERLSIRGIDTDWATSSEEALKMAEAEFYDLAVLDIKMPRISGVSLKKELQKKYPEMKFIFMTGHGSEDDFSICSKEAGPEFYLVKPVDIKILVEKMNEALESRECAL